MPAGEKRRKINTKIAFTQKQKIPAMQIRPGSVGAREKKNWKNFFLSVALLNT
jgi:hypothetical protein